MSDNDRATQAEQLIARMQAARYIYPEWELAARTDPDWRLQPHHERPGRGAPRLARNCAIASWPGDHESLKTYGHTPGATRDELSKS